MSKPTPTPDNWKLVQSGKAMKRELEFQDFKAAWAFMTHVAFLADGMDHHPEFKSNYNKLTLTLTTHDKGGLTPKDYKLAKAINDLLWHSVEND